MAPLKIEREDEPQDPFGEPTPMVEEAGDDLDPPGAAANVDAVMRHRQLWDEAMAKREEGDEVTNGLDDNNDQQE